MSGTASVSVVIPSRGRPYLIPGLVQALRYLTFPVFEVILIGEYDTVDAYDLPDEIKRAIHYFPCYEASVGAARNIGIRAARGEVVAFIDDDAIPEPDWLDRLVAPFADSRVGMAGGRVRDRDGVTLQFNGARFDKTAEETPLEEPDTPRLCWPEPGQQVGLMGTNSAFRRSALMAVGGFDESYRYYLDETDVVQRLANQGWWLAWAPEAEVHHHSDQNGMRGKNRQPRDPFELAASKTYFCARHAPEAAHAAAISRFKQRGEAECDRHIRLGHITGAERAYMVERCRTGLAEGQGRSPRLPLFRNNQTRVILPFGERLPANEISVALVACRGVTAAIQTEYLGRALMQRGFRVSLISFGNGNHPLNVGFVDGVWAHSGGIWALASGPSLGAFLEPLTGRLARAEIARVAARRRFDAVIRPLSWSLALGSASARRIPHTDRRLKLAIELCEPARADAADLIQHIESEVIASIEEGRPGASRTKAATGGMFGRQKSASVSPG